MGSNMNRRRRRGRAERSGATKTTLASNASTAAVAVGPVDFAVRYAEACGLAARGKIDRVPRIYLEPDAALVEAQGEVRMQAPFVMILRRLQRWTVALMKRSAGWHGRWMLIRIAWWQG